MPEFQLSSLDVSILLGTLLLVVAVGIWVGRGKQTTASGYFLASGKLPWWLIGSGFVATSISSEQIVGTNAASYEQGLSITNWEWFTLPSYSLLILIFIPIYLKNRITTVPDFLGRRYGQVCADLYSWIMLVAYIFIFLTTTFYGGSLTISELTGWNFYVVLWTMTVLAGLYTIKGGLTSVMWTDAVQCLLLVGGGIVLFVVALWQIPGGWPAMTAASPDRFHLYRPPDDPLAPFLGLCLSAFGTGLFYQATNQVMIQRVLGARSTWDGVMGIIMAAFINFIRPLVTCFLGLIIYHWIVVMKAAPELENPDTAFSFALFTFAHSWGIRGIVLSGFLAAIMSTVSSLVNSTGTIFSLDVYRRLTGQTSDRKLVRSGQIASLVALGLGAVLAPMIEHLGGLFRFFQMGVSYLATPFASVVLLGVLSRRTGYACGLFGIIGGVIIQVAVAVGVPLLGFDLHWFYLAAIAQVTIMTGMLVLSRFTQPPRREQWEPFCWQIRWFKELDRGVTRPWFQNYKLWFAVYVCTWAAVYWHFW